MAKDTLTIRLPAELKARLEAASQAGPYRLTLTAIVVRGIVLACDEIERSIRFEGDQNGES